MAERRNPKTTILCAVDGSDHAARAVAFAAGLAASTGAKLDLLAVNRVSPASGYPPIRLWSAEEAEHILATASRLARTKGAKRVARILVESGDIAGAVLDTAAARGAAHVVVGTGEASLVGRLLMGSVAEAVVRRSPCTVTVAR